MPSVQGKGCLTHKTQASEIPNGPSFIKFNDGDHKDPLKSNKPGPPKAFIEPPQAPPLPPTPENSGANRYSQQKLDRIIQTFF